MTSTEKDFDEFKTLYCELFRRLMVLNAIKEIRCISTKEHFFDRLVMNGEALEVYKYGLKKPFTDLCYSFTVDYARCLSYIEDDLFLTERKGTPMHGMVFTYAEGLKNN